MNTLPAIRPQPRVVPWQDLLGIKFLLNGRDPLTGLDCRGLVHIMADRAGLHFPDPSIPDDWRERGMDPFADIVKETGLVEVSEGDVQFGDIVSCSWYGPGRCDHVAFALGDGYMLHSVKDAGVVRTRIGAARRTKKLLGIYRTPGYFPPEIPPPPSEVPATGEVLVVLIRNHLGQKRERIRLPWREGLAVRSCLPASWRKLTSDTVVVTVNGDRVHDWSIKVPDGAMVVVTSLPAGEFLIAFLGSLLFSVLSYFANLLFGPSLPKPKNSRELGSPTFRLGGIQNTALPGITIPVIYGKHIVGGNMISVFFDVDGSGRQILYMLIGISEGPIKSIGGITVDSNELTGTQIPASIKINGQPARDFKECKVSVRLGSELQEPIPGFFNLNTAVPFERTLLKNEPFVHVTGDKIDGFRFVINFPGGLYNLNDEGETGSRTVNMKFSYRPLGGTWVDELVNYQAAKRAPFSKKFEKQGIANGIYELKVERLHPPHPEADADKQSQTDLVEIVEMRARYLAHPGLALLAIVVPSNDQLPGGNPPTVTSEVEGRTVWVWDGVSETTPNFGTNEVYSQNPAWCLLDAVMHPRYGLAKQGYAQISKIDLSEFDAFADNSDLSVSDGRGGMVPRAQFDMVFDTTEDAWDILQAAANSAWGSLVVLGDLITVVVLKAKSPVAMLNMGNSADFALDYVGKKTRKNVIEVQYRNRETDYEEDQATRVNPEVFSGVPVRKESMNTVGVVRPPQAYRLATFRRGWEEKVGKSFSIVAGIEAIHVLPGEVIYLSHEAVAWGKSGLCIADGTTTTIKLDQAVTVVSGDRVLAKVIVGGQEQLEERTPNVGTYAAGDAITVSVAFSAAPLKESPYAIGALATYVRPFIVMEIETMADFKRKLTGVLYDATVFSDDPGPVETFTKTMPNSKLLPAAPEFVTLVETESAGPDGTVIPAIDVFVEKENQAQPVDVFYRTRINEDIMEPGNWRWAGRTSGEKYRLVGLPHRSRVEVSVVPVSPAGARVGPEQGTYRYLTMAGRQRRPTNINSADVVLKTGHLTQRFLLPEHPDRDFLGYDIHAGKSWFASIRRHCRLPCGEREVGYVVEQDYLIRPINRTGKASGSQVALAGNASAVNFPVGYVAHISQDEAPAWSGTKTNTTDTGTDLELNVGGGLTGTYESAEIDGTTIQKCYVSIALGSQLKNTEDMEWDEAGFGWDDPAFADMDWDSSQLSGFEPECDEDSTWDDMDIPWDSTLCNLRSWEYADDMLAALEPTLEFRTYNGSTWSAYSKFTPQVVFSLQKIQVKVTLRSPDVAYIPVLTYLKINCYRMDAGTLAIDDPNSHYAGPDTLIGRSEELGYVLAETTRNWFNDIAVGTGWEAIVVYKATPNIQATDLPDGVTTGAAWRHGLIPKWYQKNGSVVITVKVIWSAASAPASNKNWLFVFTHKTYDAGDASFGSDTVSGTLIQVPTTVTPGAPRETVIDITSGDFGAGDLRFSFAAARVGGDANDDYTDTISVYSIEIVSGVKNT